MNNPLYKNQGIHVEVVVFTVDEGKVKTLLLQRGVGPFLGEWIVPGGAVWNNESVDDATVRELEEKTGLENVFIKQFYTFGAVDRDPRMRMVSVAYLALIDMHKVDLQHRTLETMNSKWCDIKDIPHLAFDHNKICDKALEELQHYMLNSNIAKDLFYKQFTMPELQKVYEAILDKEFDRRNFRRKLLSLGIVEKTGQIEENSNHRPGEYYRFINDRYEEIDIF
ncbi:MAG: hypothetical protein A2Y22_07760 [Clostridiales bacterium GWD2_32_59]|nr:MAG: hypothetical protein A2Y22_07760 [Clostridiales bacterium GWD2_32_59]